MRSPALALAIRALALGALGYALVQLLATTQYYATALVVAGLVALLSIELSVRISRLTQAAADDRVPGSPSAFDEHRQADSMQGLLDTVTSALIVLHGDGRIVLVNRAAHRLAGQPAERLASLDAVGVAAAAQIDALPVGSHRLLRLANGRRVLASVAGFTPAGAAPGRLLSLQRVAGELDAVELQAWEDMTRVLAHEMMNSLTPIASLSESLEFQLRGVDAASEAADSLEAIRRRSRGLMEFVDRYRSLADRPRPQPQSLRVSDVISGIERLMSTTLRERGVTYRSRITPVGLTCAADRQLLEQALINLVRNGMDAAVSTTQPLLEVSCCARGEHVEISVIDNGPGLDDEERDRIFVPFYTTKAGGSGIGLSLVRYVALAHGGQLEVTAGVPRGTRFTLRLPA